MTFKLVNIHAHNRITARLLGSDDNLYTIVNGKITKIAYPATAGTAEYDYTLLSDDSARSIANKLASYLKGKIYKELLNG